MKKQSLFHRLKVTFSLRAQKIWNVFDWSYEVPLLHQEMEYARQPIAIRRGVMLNLCYKRYYVNPRLLMFVYYYGYIKNYLLGNNFYYKIIYTSRLHVLKVCSYMLSYNIFVCYSSLLQTWNICEPQMRQKA